MVTNKVSFITEIDQLKKNNLYRKLRNIQNLESNIIMVDGKKAINLNSNDYLGLSFDKRVIADTRGSINYISQCSSRLVSGNSLPMGILEEDLARHRKTESSLIFTSGYSAVLGVLSSIADANTTIFSDELNHASIIDGCTLSGAKIRIFKHLDSEKLHYLIGKTDGKKIVVTEGVFSIGGDISNINTIFKISKEFGALTIMDDAHGDFIFGENGSGTQSYCGATDLVDIHISSLSKALGCFGGYVAADKKIKEYLVNKSRQFIYTSALPSHLCSSAISALKIVKNGKLQIKLFKNIKRVSNALKRSGFDTGNSKSQIIPLKIGDEVTAMKFGELLLSRGVFVQALRYPTVKKGSAVIRISITAAQSKSQLDRSIDEINNVGKKLNII